MADEVTSSEIRTRQFGVVRKGYDRNQVEVFLAQIARQFDELETSIVEASGKDIPLGIDDAETHARELSTIGGEIDVILEAARSAAEGMRSRAAADAESWTSEAKAYVEDSTSQADDQAHAARGSAWDEGSSMLDAATTESAKMVTDAETDALRIRAEAEREAIRYTADAKRTSEEVLGAAELEAEGILSTSRAESERVMRAANQSAELAQERARALEDRRAELLVELESTRSSIGDLETEFESKRQALEEPAPVVAPEYEGRTHHESDTGSVKIISGGGPARLNPVDADSFVAEVAELHRSAAKEVWQEEPDPNASLPQPAGGDVEVAGVQVPDAGVQVPDAGVQVPDTELQSEGAKDPDASLPQLAGGDVEVGGVEIPDAGVQIPDEDSSQPEEEQPSAVSRQPSAPEDSIGSLFARLREDSPQSDQDSAQLTVDSSQSEEVSSAKSSEAESGERRAEIASDTESTVEPDIGSLIPAQNAALRTIKRQLVDLQNDALEHLRTDEGWVPGEEFTDQFSEPFSILAIAITDDGDDNGAASVFATDLYDAVSSAVISAREAGSGDRAIAAAISKVFRTWRSDEAERRVVATASVLSER